MRSPLAELVEHLCTFYPSASRVNQQGAQINFLEWWKLIKNCPEKAALCLRVSFCWKWQYITTTYSRNAPRKTSKYERAQYQGDHPHRRNPVMMLLLWEKKCTCGWSCSAETRHCARIFSASTKQFILLFTLVCCGRTFHSHSCQAFICSLINICHNSANAVAVSHLGTITTPKLIPQQFN